MTHAFDLSPSDHAWATRDGHRTSTAARPHEVLTALRCTLPSLPDSVPGDVRVAVTGEATEAAVTGVPVTAIRQMLVTSHMRSVSGQ